MMDTDTFEKRVLARVRTIVTDYAPELERKGIRPEVSGVEQHVSNAREISVWLWRGDDLVDVIEFFVTKDGRSVVDEDELVEWVRDELSSAVGRLRDWDI
jgi:hypothetical protein